MSAIKYEELEFPNFVNTHPAISITGRKAGGATTTITMPLSDVAKIVVLSGCSLLNIGDTRCGKSRLMRDIHQYYFGGDADDKGSSNWNVARNDFTADGYFMTLDQSRIGEGRGILAEARIPVARRTGALCNIMDELNLAIPEVQVEFFGIAEGRHKGMLLGREGYHLFMASCNLNRVNGDFAGTSQINRALLNRIGATIDFDYFRATDEDLNTIMRRQKDESLRDISNKILSANDEIMKVAEKEDSWLDAYLRLFSSGIDYCHKDKDKVKKRAWPVKCGDCTFKRKSLCSLVKQSNTGTAELMKRFAIGINYLVSLKHPDVESLEPFDLALEAFKFTTYHGNLNGIETASAYAGEDQEQMQAVIGKIRTAIEPVKGTIDMLIESAVHGTYESRIITFGRQKCVYTPENEHKLKDKKVGYNLVDTAQTFRNFGEETGIRLDWLPEYLKSLVAKGGL